MPESQPLVTTLHPVFGRAWAKAARGAGVLAHVQNDHILATDLLNTSLAIGRALNDAPTIAAATTNLGGIALRRGDYLQAIERYEEALAAWRALDARAHVALVLNNLGGVYCEQQDLARAEVLYHESLAIKRELGDRRGIAMTMTNLGKLVQLRGDLTRAHTIHEENLALQREIGQLWGVAASLGHLGSIAYEQAHYDQAWAWFKAALQQASDISAPVLMIESLEGISGILSAWHQFQSAARLLGAADHARKQHDLSIPPVERSRYEQIMEQSRLHISSQHWEQAWQEGQALTLENAVAEALSLYPSPGSDS